MAKAKNGFSDARKLATALGKLRAANDRERGYKRRIAFMEDQDAGVADLLKKDSLESRSTLDMLKVIAARGGHPGAIAEAALLCAKKSEDYNRGAIEFDDMHKVSRDEYFPLGLPSYAQMLHTKSMRLVSLSRSGSAQTNFESARDTCLDLVNYAGFCADWLQRKSS